MNNDANALPQSGTFRDSIGNELASADHLLSIKKMTGPRLGEMKLWLRYEGPVVYFVGPHRGGLVKIGYASNLANRLRHLQTGSPVELLVLAAAAGSIKDERRYHEMFAAARRHGEWFERTPEIKAEMSRLQDVGAPQEVHAQLGARGAAIRKFWREENKRNKAKREGARHG